MKGETEALLNQFAETSWFENVGRPVETSEVEQVSTWQEAFDVLNSKVSHKVRIESINVLTRQLHNKARDRYRLWNDLVKEMRARIKRMVRKKSASLRKTENPPKDFEEKLFWDILNACMELEYADIVPPKFFADRAKWYLAGHFPCGWEGDFPEGRLIVF